MSDLFLVRRVVYFKDLELALNTPPPGYELFQLLPYADTEMFVTVWQKVHIASGTNLTSTGTVVMSTASAAETLLRDIEANPLGKPKKGASK